MLDGHLKAVGGELALVGAVDLDRVQGLQLLEHLGADEGDGPAVGRDVGIGVEATGFQGQPAFTPDGHHLVYDCGDCPGGQGIFIIRDDGTGRRRLTTSPFPTRG